MYNSGKRCYGWTIQWKITLTCEIQIRVEKANNANGFTRTDWTESFQPPRREFPRRSGRQVWTSLQTIQISLKLIVVWYEFSPTFLSAKGTISIPFRGRKRGKELASRKCTAAYDPGATSRNKCDRLNLWSSRCVIKVTRFQSLLKTEALLRLVEKIYFNSKGCVIYLALKLFLISWFIDLWT